MRLRDDSGNVRGFQQIRSEGMGSFHPYRYLIAALTKTMTMSKWQFPTRYRETTEIEAGNDLEGTNVTAETMVNHASSRVETSHDGRYREYMFHCTLARYCQLPGRQDRLKGFTDARDRYDWRQIASPPLYAFMNPTRARVPYCVAQC